MIDIVVPVYNEGANIEPLLNKLADTIRTPKRVLIVYDLDTDDTLPVVRRIAENYSFEILLVRNAYGRGALNAIRTGFQTAVNESVLVVMADLSDSLEIVDRMYGKMTQENYDLICGSRYMRGGKQHGGPFWKGLFSRLAGISLHLLTRIPTHDISNSFKMYRRSMLDRITIESDGGFEIAMEITVKAYLAGYRITEIPSEWFDRDEGSSRFQLKKWIPKYLHWYFYCIGRTWSGKKKPSVK